jgi:hypothetical protein
MTPNDPTPLNPNSDQRAPLASLTLKGALTMALAYAAGRIGIHLPDGVLAASAQALVDLLFAIGLAAVGVGRARAKAPLT